MLPGNYNGNETSGDVRWEEKGCVESTSRIQILGACCFYFFLIFNNIMFLFVSLYAFIFFCLWLLLWLLFILLWSISWRTDWLKNFRIQKSVPKLADHRSCFISHSFICLSIYFYCSLLPHPDLPLTTSPPHPLTLGSTPSTDPFTGTATPASLFISP